MEPLDQRLNLRFTKTEKEQIKILAKKDGRTMSNLCRMIVVRYIEENMKK